MNEGFISWVVGAGLAGAVAAVASNLSDDSDHSSNANESDVNAAKLLVLTAETAHQVAEDLITDAQTDGLITPEEQQAIQDAVDAATAAEQAAQEAVTALPESADKDGLQDRIDALTDLDVPAVTDPQVAADALVTEAETAEAAAETALSQAQSDNLINPTEVAALEAALADATTAKETAQAAVDGLPATVDSTDLQTRLDALDGIEIPAVNDANSNGVDDAVDTQLSDVEAAVALAEQVYGDAVESLDQAQNDGLISQIEFDTLSEDLAAAQNAKDAAQAAVDGLPAELQAEKDGFQERLDALKNIEIPAVNDADNNGIDDAIDSLIADAEAAVAAAEQAYDDAAVALEQAQLDGLISQTEFDALTEDLATAQAAKDAAQAEVDALPAEVQEVKDGFQDRLNGLTEIEVPPVSDTTPPEIIDLVATSNPNGSATITGKTEQGATVVLTNTNGQVIPVTVNPDGSFVATIPAPAVVGDYTVTATDEAGNDATATTTLIDNIPPQNITVEITSISDDSGTNTTDFITTDTTLTVSGTISRELETGEKVQVDINGTWTDATVSGTTWSIDDPTVHPVGDKTYNVRVVDAATNVGPIDSQVVKVVEVKANDDINRLAADLTPQTNTVDDSTSVVTIAAEGLIIGSDSTTESNAYTVGEGEVANVTISGSQIGAGAYLGALTLNIYKFSEVTGNYELYGRDANFGSAVAIGLGLASGTSNQTLTEGKYIFIIGTAGFGLYAGLGSLNIEGSSTDYGDVRAVGNVITEDVDSNDRDVTDVHTGTVKLVSVSSEITAEGTKTVSETDVDVGTKILGQYGTLTIYNNGGYIYDRNPSASNVGKTDTFTYTIKDEWGNTSTAKLNVQIGTTTSGTDGLVFDDANPNADAKYTIDAVNNSTNTSAALTVAPTVTQLAYDYPYTNSYITSPDGSQDRAQIDYTGNATGLSSKGAGTLFDPFDRNYSDNFTVVGNSLLKMSYNITIPTIFLGTSTATMKLYVQK